MRIHIVTDFRIPENNQLIQRRNKIIQKRKYELQLGTSRRKFILHKLYHGEIALASSIQ